MNVIDKIYPGGEIIGASEIFIPKKGWVDIIAMSKEDALSFAVGKCPMGKIEKIQLNIRFNGSIVYADFSIDELRSYIEQKAEGGGNVLKKD